MLPRTTTRPVRPRPSAATCCGSSSPTNVAGMADSNGGTLTSDDIANPYRIEHDTMGEVRVPARRAVAARRPSGRSRTSRSRARPIEPALIRALAAIKGAAARGQRRARRPRRRRSPTRSSAAADEVADGRHDDQFPIDVFQTGSGTSSNMNTNEVIATLATERARRSRSTRTTTSTPRSRRNDVFPTAIHVAATARHRQRPDPGARAPGRRRCERKADEFADVVKSGRTHLMDATPVTLGQEFGGYAAQVRPRHRAARGDRCPGSAELPLGGTAVGTGINTPPGFAAAVIDRARRRAPACR